ncbi:MAG: AAA family ATPase [Thermodesulfobacteriota bacterium]
MIQKADIKNFTAFQHIDLDLAPGLNVFIGENGTGKSHILKLLYTVLATSAEEGKKPGVDTPTKTLLQTRLADKLVNVFRPDYLGRLTRRKQGRERCEVQIWFDMDSFGFLKPSYDIEFKFSTQSKSEVLLEKAPKDWIQTAPVFLPTRELLTIYPGFLSVYEGHYLEFEETWRDTCLLLGAPALKGPKEKAAKALLKPLEEAMGGSIVLDKNGRFYLKTPGQGAFEMHLVAEGLRKLAVLSRLIATGSLLDKGFLFWDEPETNLNPKLIRLIAEAIFNICKNGIQVFVATHSLFLVRELSILASQSRFRSVSQAYFALESTPEGVAATQGATIEDVEPLLLLDEELSQSDRFLAEAAE